MSTIELSAENFESTILENDTVIIDFWADWCGPCKAFAPTFEAASDKHTDIVFAKVDTEAQGQLAAALEIRSIPTLMVFRDKILLYRDAGALPPPALDALIEQVMNLDMDEVRKDIEAQEAEQGKSDGDGDSE